MPMDFVKQNNIARFERLLLSEPDEEKRAMLHRLLVEERAKPDIASPAARPGTKDDQIIR